jgi:hypothetical protein
MADYDDDFDIDDNSPKVNTKGQATGPAKNNSTSK